MTKPRRSAPEDAQRARRILDATAEQRRLAAEVEQERTGERGHRDTQQPETD